MKGWGASLIITHLMVPWNQTVLSLADVLIPLYLVLKVEARGKLLVFLFWAIYVVIKTDSRKETKILVLA